MSATADQELAELRRAYQEMRSERDAALAALVRRNTEYGERIEYQAATIDVLKTMSASPSDAQPVFDLIVRRARDLSNASAASLLQFDGELVHLRSIVGVAESAKPGALDNYKRLFPMVPNRVLNTCRAILDRQTIHVRDLQAEPGQMPVVRDLGQRSQIALPLLRDGVAIGTIALGANNCSHGCQLALRKKGAPLQIGGVASATSPVEQHRDFEIRVEVRANAQQPFRVTLCRVRQTLPEPGFIDATTHGEDV